MPTPVTMPDLGVSRAVLSLWFVEPGSMVEEGERLLEILAGAATFDLAAPASGRLVECCARPTDRVLPGQVLGYIEDDKAINASERPASEPPA
jgi:pyruvate/2-oxoglutarate dehydrogenase complex dihydrolipoamide acyltransferase (E2) component